MLLYISDYREKRNLFAGQAPAGGRPLLRQRGPTRAVPGTAETIRE
jgi:hypothetical protein